jgi:N5-(carboxyethyl)ornithine synthase
MSGGCKKMMGFPIGHKENEMRRALIPSDLAKIQNVDMLYFETGYGDVLGYEDNEYLKYGAHIVTRKEVLQKDIICDPKIGDAEYLSDLHDGQTIFGWVHLVQNRDITDAVIESKLTTYVWEDMFEEGRHSFWRNNEMAGEAAIMHAFQCYGEMPYNTKVALIGRGNVASGALRILTCLGADVTVYTRNTEKLLQRELEKYDVIVNALLWDTHRKDHIIYKKDLKRLQPNALIIDISCDRAGAIESSIPTTIEKPVYMVDGVMHYAVDHTPSLFYKTATMGISEEVCKYVDELIEDRPGKVLQDARAVKDGVIVDQRINDYQGR